MGYFVAVRVDMGSGLLGIFVIVLLWRRVAARPGQHLRTTENNEHGKMFMSEVASISIVGWDFQQYVSNKIAHKRKLIPNILTRQGGAGYGGP